MCCWVLSGFLDRPADEDSQVDTSTSEPEEGQFVSKVAGGGESLRTKLDATETHVVSAFCSPWEQTSEEAISGITQSDGKRSMTAPNVVDDITAVPVGIMHDRSTTD